MTPMTIEQAMEIAVGHHQAGRLAEAEAIYRQVLSRSPDHAEALHLLGVLASQVGRTEVALELIGRAIIVNPGVALYHSNLGEIYRRSGQSDRAIDHFRRAIELRPDAADPHNNLGNVLREQGRLDDALALYRRAIELNPDLAEAHGNLGIVLHDQGRIDSAIAAYRRAIALKPDLASAHTNLGRALQDQGRIEEAIAAYRKAIALKPDYAPAHTNLGCALGDQGRPEEAIAAFHRAIGLAPDLAEPHNNLGNVLTDQGRLAAAIAAYHRAIQLRPSYAEAHSNLGNALKNQGGLEEAIAAYRRAIALKPDLADAHNNLGNALKDLGRVDEALACCRRAVELKPDFTEAASNSLLTLLYHPGYDAQALLAEHRLWAMRYADPLAAEIRYHQNDRAPERKLRVGYVSPDFRGHPVGYLLLPLFANHDRRQVEIVGYSDVRVPDALTAKLEALSDAWCISVGLSDRQLAERIRGDGIDILVDLALHTAGNRLLVFARKPAPVQVTMLGMPGTTGLETIDYRLTDPYFDPPGSRDGDYSEQSLRLPHTFWCYQPAADSPPVSPLPATKKGFLTFGCLNQLAKVSSQVLRLWVKILQSVPGSRLVLHAPAGAHRQSVRALFADAGIAPDRLEFVPMVPRHEYLCQYHQLDLCLDPFPFSGGVTTMDALWMGVPVIALAGRTAVGRSGVSLLSNVGLRDLIAETPDEYVDCAVALAGVLVRLSELRGGFRQRMEASPLVDGKQYALDVEAAFRRIWRSWCNP